MSEENIENVELVENIESQPIENDVQETVEEQPKPYKERKIPESIPYKRFQEVNHKVKEYESKTSELEYKLQEKEKEIQKYMEKQENVRKYGSIEDIKANLNNMSPEEMVESLAAVMETRVGTQFEERKRKEEEARYTNELLTNFGRKITEAESRYPDIKEMVGYIEHHANQLHPMIRQKLLTDEYSADLIAEIASDQALLQSLIDSPPYESIALIGELRAQYKKPAQAATPQIRTPNIPNGNVANGNKKIPSGVSMAEYKRLRSLGYT
jgi:predicted RNase H-like nuclease (RuvC/YqgF family)